MSASVLHLLLVSTNPSTATLGACRRACLGYSSSDSCRALLEAPTYQIKNLLFNKLTKLGDMSLPVQDTFTQSHFAVHVVYCTRRVRAVYEQCTGRAPPALNPPPPRRTRPSVRFPDLADLSGPANPGHFPPSPIAPPRTTVATGCGGDHVNLVYRPSGEDVELLYFLSYLHARSTSSVGIVNRVENLKKSLCAPVTGCIIRG